MSFLIFYEITFCDYNKDFENVRRSIILSIQEEAFSQFHIVSQPFFYAFQNETEITQINMQKSRQGKKRIPECPHVQEGNDYGSLWRPLLAADSPLLTWFHLALPCNQEITGHQMLARWGLKTVTGILHLRATSPKSSPFPSCSGRAESIWDLLHGNKSVLGVFLFVSF